MDMEQVRDSIVGVPEIKAIRDISWQTWLQTSFLGFEVTSNISNENPSSFPLLSQM